MKNHRDSTDLLKTLFIEGSDIVRLLTETLGDPFHIYRQKEKGGKCVFFREFNTILGYRGVDGAPCYWIGAVVNPNRTCTNFTFHDVHCFHNFSQIHNLYLSSHIL